VRGARNRRIVWLILLMTAILVACNSSELEHTSSPQPEISEQSAIIDEYSKHIEEVMEEDGVPGAAVAIIKGDEIVFMEGFGFQDVVKGMPVTTSTLFHIGSTNKSMTSMMIAALIDEGLFKWDTPVVEIYPEFELSSPESTNTVTIRHLLSMQSGIPDDAENEFDVDEATAEDVFDFIADAPLQGKPGEEFSYSNLSASIAGYLGVLANGDMGNGLYDGYAALLKETVLDPIGMKTAVIRVSDAQSSPHYGKSYTLNQDGEPVEADPEDFDGDPLAPSGTVKANVHEMALYVSTQLNRGLAPNGKQVVSEENLAETWKPSLEAYGMGWEVISYEDIDIITHEGSYDNYLSIIGFIPELDVGFVILTNSEEASGRMIQDSPYFLVDLLLDDE